VRALIALGRTSPLMEVDVNVQRIWLPVLTMLAMGAACTQPDTPTTDTPPRATPATGDSVAVRVLEDPYGIAEHVGDGVAQPLAPEIEEFVPHYVIRLNTVWTPGQGVQVCFFGGDTTLRRRIRDAALTWTKHGNIALDFGPDSTLRSCGANDASDIRIGFTYPGYWSVVGNTRVRAGMQTMNYGGYTAAPPAEPRFTGVVLHEFGHALGFEHEHQHPQGGCDEEFDWPTVYEQLARPPNNWPRTKVDFNLRAFRDTSAYGISAPDRTSIMHYSLDPWMFRNGVRSKCYVAEQFGLSPLDRQGIASIYPSAPQAEQSLLDQRRRIDRLTANLPANALSARKYLEAVKQSLDSRHRELTGR
jgi:hypothetical protein